ncbi:Predicted Zn-dependent peptidase [Cohaesibacter sp. ES.047]|uniref:M16 family metallopeptidase n=1 Tax=Cohaesibacter sp. ES.047 TaxID=1798205 RepID=UPI000BB6B21D|nr:pitrilysin family protein [Cohaesibacter sp. ES.047]SNY92053.1 Predicted Zn-dependent peptidase [Cohaesibacter sp. ES.047]
MTVNMSSLANGLTVLSDEMPHLKSTAVGVWVSAGSRHEKAGQHGISHLLEHMAFKGTSNRSAVAIVEEIEAVGGELNAATGLEHTSYYARVLEEDLPLAIDILGDILVNSSFDPDELHREKHVILQEIGASHDMPEDRVFDHLQELAFPGQPLGRTILGTPDTVSDFNPSDLHQYMDTHYRGPSMILSAAGAVKHEELVALGKEALSSFDAEESPLPTPATYLGGESRDLQRDLMEAQVILAFEGRSYKDKDFYTAQILATMLGGGMSSRLFQEVREKRGLCYSVYAFHWGVVETGLFGIHAATGAENLEELMPVITGELARAAEDLTEVELNRARAQIKAGLLMGMESPSARAGQLARQKLLFGHPKSLEEMIDSVANISVADVRDLAGNLITGSPPSMASVGPVENLMWIDEISSRLGCAPAATEEQIKAVGGGL